MNQRYTNKSISKLKLEIKIAEYQIIDILFDIVKEIAMTKL